MNPNQNQRSNFLTFFSLGLFLVLVVLFGVYNSQGGFGPSDAGANEITSDGVVSSASFLEPLYIGESFGIGQYYADTDGIGGFSDPVALVGASFMLENLPIGSFAEACVYRRSAVGGVETRLYCLGRNLEISSQLVHQQNLPFGIAVAEQEGLFCRLKLSDLSQDGSVVTKFSGSCELDLVPVSLVENLVYAHDRSYLATWRQIGISQNPAISVQNLNAIVAKNLVYGSDASLDK
ncbi:MAG: hypothetical protein ACOCXP_01580, partial [Candidatus Dojkabacteria bacterium]